MPRFWFESKSDWAGLQRELSRWFDAARTTVDNVVGQFTWPPVNTWETPEEVFVVVEAPGLSASEFDLSFANQTLVVRCVRKAAGLPEGTTYERQERPDGRFERAIVLPATLDASAVKAKYDRGVLVIHIPKVPAARPRKIVVEEGR